MEGLNLQLFDAIAWTIIHSLWQGGLVFIVTLSLFLLNKQWNSKIKYNIALMAMVSLFFTCMLTFVYQYAASSTTPNGLPSKVLYYYFTISPVQNNSNGIVNFINDNTLLISNFWMLGFFILSMRYLISYVYIFQQAKKSPNLDLSNIGIDLERVKQHFGLKKEVIVKTFDKHVSPFTLGFIKPMVFFPMTLVTLLEASEIEAILAHELAHIKRNDFITNAFSSMIEVVMYYHPVVWWLQKQLDIHRENACDDMAIGYVGDKMVYAKSLVKLQECLQAQPQPTFAMAFTGNRKSIFLNRIKRMFNMPYTQINIKEKLIASMVLFLLALGITEVYAHKTKTKNLSLINTIKDQIIGKPTKEMTTDSLPSVKKKEAVTIIKSDGEKDVEVKLENGKVTYLNIDGKEIPQSEYDQHKDLIEEIQPLQSNGFKGLNGDFGAFKNFNFDNLGRGFNFSFGGPKGGMDRDYEHFFKFNFDSLRENLMFDRDSMMAFFHNNKFNSDSIFKQFNDHDIKMFFPDGGGIIDLRGEPGKSIRIYRGDIENDFDNGSDGSDRIEIDGLDRRFEDRAFPRMGEDSNLESIIGKQLNRDGFLIAGKKNKVELSGKNLKINGEKQPSNIWNKYKQLFETETGLPLSKDTKLVFEIDGKEQNRKKRNF